MMIWRFRRLLDAHGGDPARWPEEERAAAEDLLRRSADARAALAEARSLDELLHRNIVPSPDNQLADRIIDRALAHPQEPSPMNSPLPLREGERGRGIDRGSGRGFRFGLWPQLAGLAAAGLLGFILGASDLGPSNADNSIDLSDVVDLNSDLEDPLS